MVIFLSSFYFAHQKAQDLAYRHCRSYMWLCIKLMIRKVRKTMILDQPSDLKTGSPIRFPMIKLDFRHGRSNEAMRYK